MLTVNKADQSSWRKNRIVIVCQYVFFIACVVGSIYLIRSAFREDKRQQDYSDKYYLPAIQDFKSNHYQEAISKLQANLQAYPDDYKANFEMGLVLLKLDKSREARIYFVSAQNSFLSHHGRFSTWERYNAAQHEISKIDRKAK